MIDAIERLYRRLLYTVRRGRLLLADDSGPAQLLQAGLGANATHDNLPRLAEYGFQSMPPAGADVVVLCLGGNASDAVVIATGHQTYRLRNLGAGEVAISDDKGQRVHLTAAGIHIVAVGTLTIDATALQVNANTTFNGTVTANGHAIDQTHRHSGVTTGGSNTGAVT